MHTGIYIYIYYVYMHTHQICLCVTVCVCLHVCVQWTCKSPRRSVTQANHQDILNSNWWNDTIWQSIKSKSKAGKLCWWLIDVDSFQGWRNVPQLTCRRLHMQQIMSSITLAPFAPSHWFKLWAVGTGCKTQLSVASPATSSRGLPCSSPKLFQWFT